MYLTQSRDAFLPDTSQRRNDVGIYLVQKTSPNSRETEEERVDEVKFLLKVECEQFVIFSKLSCCFTPRTPQELSRDMGPGLTHQITIQTALT
jgi:hypothetical protein